MVFVALRHWHIGISANWLIYFFIKTILLYTIHWKVKNKQPVLIS
jgi:hypothetical protein